VLGRPIELTGGRGRAHPADRIVFLAALASAITHAAWNAAARRRRDPGQGLAVVLYASALAAVPLLTIVLSAAEGQPPWRLAWSEWRFGFLACFVSYSSSLLVLYAFTHGPTGPVAALRETSVLFATGFAGWMLAERVGRLEWLSAAMAVAGIALLRLG
jgi:drug/metabolite transporter (DMT)-like permease